jgi:S1-C subfamily serine protease
LKDSNPLVALSESLADAVETGGRSIVAVNARRRLPATGLIWSADGVIVTASHVVERDEEITVTLPDGSEVAAELAGRDPSTDIAVLRASAADLTPIARAAQPARAGHLVLALGKPGAVSPMATLGVVSAIGGIVRTRRGGAIEEPIHTDLTLYPGFSGGPLLNAAGEIFGMNTSGISRGLAMAIPNAVLERVTNVLLTEGGIKHGYLGVALQPVQLPESVAQSLGGQQTGLMVIGVEADSPAAAAGVMLGDTFVSLGGEATTEPRALHAQLGPGTVGTAQPARVIRAGQPLDVSVTVGERSAPERPQRRERGGRGPRCTRGGGRGPAVLR